MPRANNLATFMCQLYRNSGNLNLLEPCPGLYTDFLPLHYQRELHTEDTNRKYTYILHRIFEHMLITVHNCLQIRQQNKKLLL